MRSTATSGGLRAAVERGLVRPASTLAATSFDPAVTRRFLQLLEGAGGRLHRAAGLARRV